MHTYICVCVRKKATTTNKQLTVAFFGLVCGTFLWSFIVVSPDHEQQTKEQKTNTHTHAQTRKRYLTFLGSGEGHLLVRTLVGLYLIFGIVFVLTRKPY